LGRSLSLDVANWAAIVSEEAVTDLGATASETIIPSGQRRRLPQFTRDVLRTALPLLRDKPRCPVILTSPHGDLLSTVTLLSDVARREPLSPALFALSVHNAPTGALSLCLEAPGDQTALAGDAGTLSVGLTEAYARLATGEVASIVLIHAEGRLPEVYSAFDDPAAPGVFLAIELTLATGDDGAFDILPDRAGAAALAGALNTSARRVRFSPPSVGAPAA